MVKKIFFAFVAAASIGILVLGSQPAVSAVNVPTEIEESLKPHQSFNFDNRLIQIFGEISTPVIGFIKSIVGIGQGTALNYIKNNVPSAGSPEGTFQSLSGFWNSTQRFINFVSLPVVKTASNIAVKIFTLTIDFINRAVLIITSSGK